MTPSVQQGISLFVFKLDSIKHRVPNSQNHIAQLQSTVLINNWNRNCKLIAFWDDSMCPSSGNTNGNISMGRTTTVGDCTFCLKRGYPEFSGADENIVLKLISNK
jgi:hypothetical protein